MAGELIDALKKTGLLDRKLEVSPFRIGMPGTPEEGMLFGVPKKGTKYPITHVKMINYMKDPRFPGGSLLIGFFSDKAGSKAITWRFFDMKTFDNIAFVDEDAEVKKLEFMKYVLKNPGLLLPFYNNQLALGESDSKGPLMIEEGSGVKRPLAITGGKTGINLPAMRTLADAKHFFYHKDKDTAYDILKKSLGWNEKQIEKAFEEDWKDYKPRSILREREGFLTARALIKFGGKKHEVNAKIESPANLPEILVGRSIPFKMLPVPAMTYNIIAVFDSPTYGLLKARGKVKVSPRKEAKIGFLFDVNDAGDDRGPGGPGGPEDGRGPAGDDRGPGGGRRPPGGGAGAGGVVYCPICMRYEEPPNNSFPLIENKDHTALRCDNCGIEFIRTEGGGIKVNPKKYKSIEDAAKIAFGDRIALLDDEGNKLKGRAGRRSWRKWTREKSKKSIEKESRQDYEEEVKKGENWLSEISHMGAKSAFSLVLAVIGIIIGGILGWPFLVAFTAWAGRNIIPSPEYKGGNIWLRRGNRSNTGLAVTRSFLKIVILFFLGWGFFVTDLPARGLVLLVFFFFAYFSLPGEYSPNEPYQFMEGIWRLPVAIILSFVVFGGVFQSKEMAWLCMSFFAVVPIAREKGTNLAAAIGQGLSTAAQTYETVDKILFVVMMLLTLFMVLGSSVLADFGAVFSRIFFPFWIVALIGGFTSPANVRPYTGIFILIIYFVFFSASAAGEQIVGQGFFGVWWPTVHNSMTSVMEPVTSGFGALGETFGNTFLLFMNPVGYAQNIMEGTYEQNPVGLTGAYGVEVEDFNVPSITPGLGSLVTMNIKNVGPVSARNVEVTLAMPEYLNGVFTVGKGTGTPNPEGKLWNRYDKNDITEFGRFSPNFAMPLLFTIDTTPNACEKITEIQNPGAMGSQTSIRNQYVRVNATAEYTYEVSSWIEVTVISNNEWQRRVAEGTFVQRDVISHISTSPAKLSLGTFEQPIIAGTGSDKGRPFYIGLNLSSEEGPGSAIIWNHPDTKVVMTVPNDVAKDMKCVPQAQVDPLPKQTDKKSLTWTGSMLNGNAAYCTTYSLNYLDVPVKTFYVRANSTFRFRNTETRDTLFSFDDVCPKTPVVNSS